MREDLDGGDFGFGLVIACWTLGMAFGARATLALQGGVPILIALGGLVAVLRIHDVRAHPEPIEEMVEAEDTQPTAPVRGEMP